MARKLRLETLRISKDCGNCGRVQGAPECALCGKDTRLKDNWIPHPRLLRECFACGYVWVVKNADTEPLCCPACHSRRWNRARKQPGPKKQDGGEDVRRGDNPAGNITVPE